MNNIIIRFKRFIGNKNTVSILTMIVGIGVLIIGYNYRVNSKINPVTVPYAKKALEARHVITEEDVGYMKVNSDVTRKGTNIIKKASDIVGKEVQYGNDIAEGSLFYTGDLVNPENSPDYVLSDIEDGYTAFSLSVDAFTTYGNQITKGNSIDLWFYGTDDTKKIIYTDLVKNIEVLDVRDSNGKSMSQSLGDEAREPAELLFAVPDSLYALLVKADKIGELVPVPTNKDFTPSAGDTKVVSEYVKNFILSKFVNIPDETTSVNNTNTNTNKES